MAGVRRDIPDVLAAMDALALPSLSEGLPYVVLEALAMERPVVASEVNGVPEILTGETGVMVRPKDSEALASELQRLHDKPELAKHMAKAGRARVLAGFSVKRMVERWSTLYDELCLEKTS